MAFSFYMDWVPFSVLPAHCQAMDVVTKSSNEFDAFFGDEVCPSFSPDSFLRVLKYSLTEFGYCIRNDGMLIFWFKPNVKSNQTNQTKDAQTARILSYGLKEALNHRHAFHGPVGDAISKNFQPVSVCSFEKREKLPNALISEFEETMWEKCSLEERVLYALSHDSILAIIPCNPDTFKNEKTGMAKLRENFSKVYDSFFRTKDRLRINAFTANNPSIATFMFLAGVFTPLWQQMAKQSENYTASLISLFTFLIFTYLLAALGLVRLVSFFNKQIAELKAYNGFVSRFIITFFGRKAPLKRKITYPLLIFFVLGASVFPFKSFPVPFFSKIDLSYLANLGLTTEIIKNTFMNDTAILTVSLIWVMGVFVSGGIEILGKRMKILKLCRYTIGVLYFGNNFTRLMLRIKKENERTFNEISFDSAIMSLHNFLYHEYLKLLSGTIIIFLLFVVAVLPAFLVLFLKLNTP